MNLRKKNLSAFSNFLKCKYARLKGLAEVNSLPYLMYIDPSSSCNLHCAMCAPDGPSSPRIRPPRQMGIQLYDSLLDELGEYLFVLFLYNWGEPLLNPHLSSFIRKAKGYDIFVDINTNLSLELPDSRLADLLTSGIDSIVASIDGFSPETYGRYRLGGNFELAKRNISRLVILRDRLGLSTEITWKFLMFSFNEHEVAAAEKYCTDHGINFVAKDAIIDTVVHSDWLPSHRQDEFSRPNPGWPIVRGIEKTVRGTNREMTCAWHYYYSSVNADGSVSPCCAVIDPASDFGKVVPEVAPFSQIWNSQSFLQSRRALSEPDASCRGEITTICSRCPYTFLKDQCTGTNAAIVARYKEMAESFPSWITEGMKRLDKAEEYSAWGEIHFGARRDKSLTILPPSPYVSHTDDLHGHPVEEGSCSICGYAGTFHVRRQGFSLREALCPECKGSRRNRDLSSVICETFTGRRGPLRECIPLMKKLVIFEAQATGPVHDLLKSLPGYLCSEFLDGVTPGAFNDQGVRCEDLQKLTLPDNCFDLVITQDVLEHVPAPQAALHEITRVLKPGGYHIFTVPLHEGHRTVTRAAMVDGKTRHLLPAVYHGDPLRASGTLVYTDFGDDLPILTTQLGAVSDIIIRGNFYEPRELPWLDTTESHAVYLESRQRGELLSCLRYNSVVIKSKKLQGTELMPRGEKLVEALHATMKLLLLGNSPASIYAEAGELFTMLDQTEMARDLFSMNDSCESGSNRISLESVVQRLPGFLNQLLRIDISATALIAAGELAFHAGLDNMAEKSFRKALAVFPDNELALNNLGVLAFRSGEYMSAERYFYQALDLVPSNLDARTNLMNLYMLLPQLTIPGGKNSVTCPCCSGSFPGFISGGPSFRRNSCCPRCGSLERHRLLWLYLQEKTNFFKAQLNVLHIAPEKIFQDAFKKLPNLNYVSADLCSPLAMIKMDITDIPFAENTFDVIICSHVLEHIPDDRKAMRELHRVLKRDGWAILQVPIDPNRAETFEDWTITEPAERQRLFGQDDHVRWYGRDYPDRVSNEGFEVSILKFASELGSDVIHRTGIIEGEDIYLCQKPSANPKTAPLYLKEKIDAIQSFIDFSVGKGFPKWPLNIFLESSNVCDLKCVMCSHFSAFNQDRVLNLNFSGKGFIDINSIKKLDNIFKHALNVNCFGYGEPTIHPNFRELIDYLSKFETLIHFFTHGMHLDKNLCDFIVDRRVSRITFSFSGANKEIYENIYLGGNFEKIITNIKYLSEAKKRSGTSFPFIAINSLGFVEHIETLVQFVDLLADCGANEIIVGGLNGAPQIPQIHSHISIFRPEIEGEIINQAKNQAKKRGILLTCTSYEQSKTKPSYNLDPEVAIKSFVTTSPENPTESLENFKNLAASVSYNKSRPANDSFRLNINDCDSETAAGVLNMAQIDVHPPCLEPFETLYIYCEGGVKPCCYWGTVEPILGDITKEDCETIWNGQGFSIVRNGIQSGCYANNGCQGCISRKTWPKRHSFMRLFSTYRKWLNEVFQHDFPSEIVNKAVEIEDNDSIIDKYRY